MKKKTPISKIMTRNIISVNMSQSLKVAYDLIKEKNIRHLPVLSNGKVVGILSKTDLDKAGFINSYDKDDLDAIIYENLTIEQVMITKIKTVQTTDSIYDTAVLLTQNVFHAVPVLDGDKLVGIVTSTDLIKYLIEII